MLKSHLFSPSGLLSAERVQFIWGRNYVDQDRLFSPPYPWLTKTMEIESLKKHNSYNTPPRINLQTVSQQIAVDICHSDSHACSQANQGLPFFALHFLTEQSWRRLPLDEMTQWQRRRHCIVTYQLNNLLNGEYIDCKSRDIIPLSPLKYPHSDRIEWADFLPTKEDKTVTKLHL